MLTDFGDFDESHRQEKMLLEIGNLTCDEDILNYIAANKLTLQDLYYISKCNEYKIKCKKQEISCKRYRVEFLNKQRLDKHKTKRPSHLIINKSIQNPNNSDYSSEKFVKLEAKLIEQIEINDKLEGELKISQNTYAEKNKELTRIENKIKQLEMEANLTDNHSENIIQSQNNIMQLLVEKNCENERKKNLINQQNALHKSKSSMLEYIKSNKITKIDNQIKETNDNGDEYSETTGYTDRSYDWDSLNYDDISNNVIPQEGTFSNIIIPKYCDKININKKLNKFENRIECKHEKIDSINIGQILKTSGNNVQDSNDTENFNYEIIMEKDANILPCIKNNKLNFKNINQPKNDVRVKFISKDIVVDAIIEGEIDLVKKLSNEIEITKEVNIDGITALHHAAFSADAEMVQFLIKLGCNVNALDVDAWTPLHCAASCDHYEISKLLVCHGASIFARTVTDNQTTKQKCEIKSEFSTCFDFLTKCEKSIRSAEKSEYYVAFNFKSENNYELSVNASDRIVINTNLTHQDDQYWIHVTLIETNNSGFIPLSHVSLYRPNGN